MDSSKPTASYSYPSEIKINYICLAEAANAAATSLNPSLIMRKTILLMLMACGLFSCSKNDSKPTGPVTETYAVNATYHKYYTNPEMDTTYSSTLKTVEYNDTMRVYFYILSGAQSSIELSQKWTSNDTIYYATNHAFPAASIRIHPASSNISFFWEWDETYVGQHVKENYRISN